MSCFDNKCIRSDYCSHLSPHTISIFLQYSLLFFFILTWSFIVIIFIIRFINTPGFLKRVLISDILPGYRMARGASASSADCASYECCLL